jgi:cytochrome c-type biogenesis protein CcmH
MIWFLCALVVLAAALLLFLRRGNAETFDSLSHYRAQLDEIAEDEARGMIDADAARAARLEVERRILKITDASGQAAAGGDRGQTAILAALLVAASFALYAFMGSPGVPAQPGVVATGRDALIQEGGPTFGEAIRSVRRHLADNPSDKEGWQVLATSARSVQDYSLAANAYKALAALEPENPGWRLQEFEAMRAMGGGQISPAARLVLADFMEANPGHPAGQFYLGLARLQGGDEAGAKAVWKALAARSAPDAPWMPRLRAQLKSLGAGLPAVSQDQMDAVAAMSGEEQQAFIRSMMDRLAARLENEPDDPEGWMMLARSHLTVGDREAAMAALERGLDLVSDEGKPPLRTLLDNLRNNPDL